MMTEGWICPKCQRGVAPAEKYCDHGGGLAGLTPPFKVGSPTPLPPAQWPPNTTVSVGGKYFDGTLQFWNGHEFETPQMTEN